MILIRIKNYFQNLSYKKDIPLLVFLISFFLVFFTQISIILIIDRNEQADYLKFYENKIKSIDIFEKFNHNDAYEAYYEIFQRSIPETEKIKNIVFILWDDKGNVLWHSNKLVQKFLANNNKTASNSLFKNMSFLDMPEKKFKPYESYRKNKGLGKSEGMITEKRGTLLLHFYKIPNIKRTVYVENLRQRSKMITIKVYLYIVFISLIASFLIAFIIYRIMKRLFLPLESMSMSIERFNKDKENVLVNYYFNNEAGLIIKNYNALINSFASAEDRSIHDVEGSNQKITSYLQHKLLLKSIRRSEQIELILYPRKPDSDFRKFVTLEEQMGKTDVLYAHFDINNIESNIEKHILQDKFSKLCESAIPVEEVGKKLVEGLLIRADLGPGFLFLHIENNRLSWIRSGPFYVFKFSKTQQGNASVLEGGYDYLSEDDIGIKTQPLLDDLILIISDDILDIMNLEADEFCTEILNPITKLGSNKEIMGRIMDKITIKQPGIFKQPVLISLIGLK